MEIVKLKIAKDTLEMLIKMKAITTDEIIIIGVEEDSFNYSQSQLWKAAKDKADKAYKELKKIEFDIRHKI